MSAVLVISTALAGLLVLGSYVVVLFDVFRWFDLGQDGSSSYFESPYWLRMHPDSVKAISVLQVVAGVGFLIWCGWLILGEDRTFENSILSTLPWRIGVVQMFLWASALWPFGAYYHKRNNNTWSAIVACIPLWVASLAAILMIGGTFEAKASAVPTVGVLVFGTIVVLADGVGWAALCIKTTTVNPVALVKPNP